MHRWRIGATSARLAYRPLIGFGRERVIGASLRAEPAGWLASQDLSARPTQGSASPGLIFDSGPKTGAARALLEQFVPAWTRFAGSGDPNHETLPSWPRYRLPERATMIFDYECRVVADHCGNERAVWQGVR